MDEDSASPIYVVFRVSGKGIASPEGSAVAELYKDGELIQGQTLQESHTYEIKAQTTGAVESVTFQYSMDKSVWVDMPTASGEPNPDTIEPFGISWLPMLAKLSADLWIDADGDGFKDSGEATYQMGDLLYIRTTANIFGQYLGRYVVTDGLTINQQLFITYSPLIPSPADPDPSAGSEIQTVLTNQPAIFIPLYQGWNLISIPVEIPSTDTSTFVQPIEDTYRSIWSYDSLLGRWRKRIKDVSDDLYVIENKKAYWIDMADDGALLIIGDLISNTSVVLYTGWNLAGYSSTDNQSTGLATSTIFDYYVASYTYDNLTKTWSKHMRYPAIPNDLFQYIPGNGYYIYVSNTCTWTVMP